MVRRLLIDIVLAACVAATGYASPPGDGDAAALGSPQHEGPPPAGVVGRCHVVEVYDGDTLTVEFTVTARVRLLGCWSDEIRTRDAAEKARGLAARDHLAAVCGMAWNGKRWVGRTPAYLAAPFAGDRLGSLFTMGRLLGRVWVLPGEGADVSTQQVEAGHAYRTKAGLSAAQGR